MENPPIRMMEEREYEMIPIEKIKVLNSRNREEEQFKENVRSIKDVGLLKPIVVNRRHLKRTGFYELVCGEGRYIAYQRLGREEIPAEVISCDRKDALLYSLVENIARVPPGTMWFAREVKRLHDDGWSFEDIGRITGKSDCYIRDYVHLVERGEDRLIKGVERGLFNITFALHVATTDNSQIQHLLMDAFDKGIVNTANLPTVRRIIDARIGKKGGGKRNREHEDRHRNQYSLKQLKNDISRITREKEAFVREAGIKENRLVVMLQSLNILQADEEFVALLQEEDLSQRPALSGVYTV